MMPTTDIQLSFEDIFKAYTAPLFNAPEGTTRTVRVLPIQINQETVQWIIRQRAALMNKYKPVLESLHNEDMAPHYSTFRIPKRNGGVRIINEPDAPLKKFLAELKDDLEFRTQPHAAAYAYVKGKTTMKCCAKHTKRQHKWWLKLDFHDFFGSCTEEFQFKQLNKIPLFYLWNADDLRKFIHTWSLNNGLPQGTPLSPWLTNQLMVPIDFEIARWCKEHDVTYTRYADDMQFSFDTKEQAKHIVRMVKYIIADTPLRLNEDKTKITSVCGQNWVLGLMCNKDFKAQIGHKKKDQFRAALFQFNKDYAENRIWAREEVQRLLGQIAYYKEIEEDWVTKTLEKYPNVRENLIAVTKL